MSAQSLCKLSHTRILHESNTNNKIFVGTFMKNSLLIREKEIHESFVTSF